MCSLSQDYARSVDNPPCGFRLRPAGAGLRSGLTLSRPYGRLKPTGAEEPHLSAYDLRTLMVRESCGFGRFDGLTG